MDFPFLNSPNKRPRLAHEPIKYIILHGTWMADDNEALERLCCTTAEVSCHYFIQRDGTTLQLVKDEDVAWHAGVSYWAQDVGLNATSLGIELSNKGHDHYTDAQYTALISLLQILVEKYTVPPKCILAHSDVSTGRKDDPGRLFDWQRLYRTGLAAPIAPESATVESLRAAGYVGEDAHILKSHALRYSFEHTTDTD